MIIELHEVINNDFCFTFKRGDCTFAPILDTVVYVVDFIKNLVSKLAHSIEDISCKLAEVLCCIDGPMSDIDHCS